LIVPMPGRCLISDETSGTSKARGTHTAETASSTSVPGSSRRRAASAASASDDSTMPIAAWCLAAKSPSTITPPVRIGYRLLPSPS
jgi:hypothetical protein